MIECFFDDSGKENDPAHRFVCTAGYIAHETFWWQFIPAWRHLLLKHGLPYLHLKEFVHVANQKGWDHRKRDEILGEFVRLIKETRLIGFGVAVDADVWRALPKPRRKSFGDAQEFCFMRLLRRIVDRLDDAKDPDRIALIFDRDFEYARPRLRLIEHIHKRDPRVGPRVASFSFADAKQYYQLQAADLLAWETRRELVNRVNGFASTSRWSALFRALPFQELDYEGEFWDQELMERSFAKVEVDFEAAWKSVANKSSSSEGSQ